MSQIIPVHDTSLALPGQILLNIKDLQKIPAMGSILHMDADCFQNTHLHFTTNFANLLRRVFKNNNELLPTIV